MTNLLWNEVENAISYEIDWLKNNIPTFNQSTTTPIKSKKETNFGIDYSLAFRNVAILIVRGEIKVKELSGKNIWINENSDLKNKHKHGKEWHSMMMNKIENYFISNGYNSTTEPNLNYGRADLGLFKNNKKNIYIEVDTVSINKLWINIQTMKNCIFLSIPSENKIIEFTT